MTYGCKNRAPFPSLIPIPAVYHLNVSGHRVLAEADEMRPYPFARDCQYTKTDLGQADKGCNDCTWRIERCDQ